MKGRKLKMKQLTNEKIEKNCERFHLRSLWNHE